MIEVWGTNTRNKGAELMLRAIADELGGDAPLVAGPRTGSYAERASLGLFQKVAHPRVPEPVVAWAGQVLPGGVRRKLTEQYGLVFEQDSTALLDASGFAYSDQFDLERSLLAAARAERARARGRRVILLPQAFGPFALTDRRDAIRRIVAAADQVYARERRSFEHLAAAGCAMDRVSIAPDFTGLVAAVDPPGFTAPDGLALLVPSGKLLTETAPEVRAAYLPFLARAAVHLRERGLEVRVLVHERTDVAVAAHLAASVSPGLETWTYDNALHLKAVISRARVLVGSRFHALVSALSQGVPAVAIGWSHKYAMLFHDYGAEDLVVAPTIPDAELATILDRLVEPVAWQALVDQLDAASADQKADSRRMWQDIRHRLGLGPVPATTPLSRV